MVKMLESKAVEIIENPKLEPVLEVIAELVSLQEEISPRLTEVICLPIETLVYLPT